MGVQQLYLIASIGQLDKTTFRQGKLPPETDDCVDGDYCIDEIDVAFVLGVTESADRVQPRDGVSARTEEQTCGTWWTCPWVEGMQQE